jgi:hypothetical protein
MKEQRPQIVRLCRLDSWQRLRPKLAALHAPTDAGPELVIDWLLDAFAPAQPEAQRVLRAIARQPWRVDALTGLYDRDPRLGFRLSAGATTWWLQLSPAPRLHIHRIERFTPLA